MIRIPRGDYAALTVGHLLMFAELGIRVAAGQDGQVVDETWTVPRTPWGVPDLAGIWNGKSITPVDRPERFVGREFLTGEEVAQLEADAFAEAGRNARATKGTTR